MEAARQLRELRPMRGGDASARELEQLRPLGEAYLLRRYGHTLARADAEDAVADVVIRLHRKIEAGQSPRNLRAAFFTSVRNAAIDQLRSRTAKPTVALELIDDAPADSATPLELVEGREASTRLQEALGRMRPNYREAILLRFGAGLTVPEIAERLQISLPAAKKLVLRSTEQVRKRLAAIEDREFCPEMRQLARRSLFDKDAAGLASDSEQRILQAHFQHCGSCKSFLSSLHRGLNELGGTALLAGGGAGLDRHLGIADQLGRWLGNASDASHAVAVKVRLAAFKATGAFAPGDAASAGAFTGTAQKIAAACGAGAATTACLATGIVGPGIGAAAVDHSTARPDAAPPAAVKTFAEEVPIPAGPTPPEAEATQTTPAAPPPSSPHAEPDPGPAEAQPAEPTPPPEPTAEEFGFESSASTSSEPAPAAPAPAPAPAPAASPAPSGGGGGGGGAESFGFGG
jgi:RNA polymerase sigma factor (sigma-70 family)